MSNDKSTKILLGALACIAANGYNATRLTDVAEAAGVSVGLIQHYFGTRQQLLNDALLHASRELVSQFQSLARSERRPWSRICGLIELLCQVPDLYGQGRMWLELSGVAPRRGKLHAEMVDVYRAWDAYVRQAVEAGTVEGSLDPSGPPDDVVAVFLAFFEGYEFEIATGLISADHEVLKQRALLLARVLFRPMDVHLAGDPRSVSPALGLAEGPGVG